MKTKYIGLVILLLTIFGSCRKYIDMKIPDKGRKPVINCLFIENNKIELSLFQSLFILDNSDSKPINNALVIISENNINWDTLINTTDGNYFTTNTIPTQGKSYYIKAWVGGIEANSFTKIPQKVPVIIKGTDTFHFDNQDWFQIKIGINDPVQDSNFYMLKIEQFENYYFSTKQYIPLDISSQDPSFQSYWKNYLVFDDQLFNGNDRTFLIDISKGMEGERLDSVSYKVSLLSIPRELYLYAKSSQAQSNIGNSPFSEPVMVFNNIVNGYGIFAGASLSQDSIKVP